jgi:hypothetical protein
MKFSEPIYLPETESKFYIKDMISAYVSQHDGDHYEKDVNFMNSRRQLKASY